MRDQDLLQCPLLGGLDAMRRAELIGLLKDSNLREKVERCVNERPRSLRAPDPPAKLAARSDRFRTVEAELHCWDDE